jgi:carbamoyl-phosphate synthase large subunit
MDSINVLVTGAGAPGIKGTIYSLHKNFDHRKVRTIGTDVNEDVVGRCLCDKFHELPRPSEDSFAPSLLSICRREKVNVILPQVTAELYKLAEFKDVFEENGTRVAVSSKKAIELSNNKSELMRAIESSNIGSLAPKFFVAKNIDSLRTYAEKLGFPEKPFVVKPPVSSGMRGLRIVDNSLDLKEAFYTKKPDDVYVRLEELERALGDRFPELLVMEYLPGKEYTVDVLATDEPVIVPRTRDLIRTGITFNATVEENSEIIEWSRKLAKLLKLEYACGFQMRLDENGSPKLIECNPRIQGTMVLSTLAGANIVYGAVKLALGEDVPNFKIRWNTRLLRYWGGVATFEGKITDEIL